MAKGAFGCVQKHSAAADNTNTHTKKNQQATHINMKMCRGQQQEGFYFFCSRSLKKKEGTGLKGSVQQLMTTTTTTTTSNFHLFYWFRNCNCSRHNCNKVAQMNEKKNES